MRVLAVTNMLPTAASPTAGTFIESQIQGLRAAGVTVDVLLLDRVQGGMKVYFGLHRTLTPRLKATAPDLIHVMYGGVMADRVTRLVRDIPVIVTFHGSDLQGEPLSASRRRWIAAYGVASSSKAARRAAGVIVVSKHLADLLPSAVDRAGIRVIPCGIDLDRFRPLDREACRRRLGWSSETFHVLFATSSGNPVKRPELARAAIERLIGRGVPAELKTMRGVPNEDVPVWINASDAILLTSSREGSPTIIKEALACDRPVVSVDVGDVGTQLAGLTGCHLMDANPDTLAEGLHRVYSERLPVRSRERMASLSLEQTARRVKEFYAEVLCRQNGRSLEAESDPAGAEDSRARAEPEGDRSRTLRRPVRPTS